MSLLALAVLNWLVWFFFPTLNHMMQLFNEVRDEPYITTSVLNIIINHNSTYDLDIQVEGCFYEDCRENTSLGEIQFKSIVFVLLLIPVPVANQH